MDKTTAPKSATGFLIACRLNRTAPCFLAKKVRRSKTDSIASTKPPTAIIRELRRPIGSIESATQLIELSWPVPEA